MGNTDQQNMETLSYTDHQNPELGEDSQPVHDELHNHHCLQKGLLISNSKQAN